ncbi:class I SAM-dependent methyltransferase [Ectopseudomonas toyotomiensis]|uniref:class I SAM-dependent methyltransferase n=1 Tax=Ectopseudomonas toyotomiensis TaxID=554344 RepID=UPI0037CBCF4D
MYKVELQSDMFNDARVIASKWIAPGSLVLDVGCACGDFGDFLHRVKDVQIHGFEYDKKSLEQAASKNVYKSLSQVDLNFFDPHAYSDFHGKFDVVALIDVLEHTVNPEIVLKKLKVFLKPDGAFVVSLPNASFGEVKGKVLRDNFEYTEMGVLDKTHLRFYTFNTIADLFSSVSFKISKCSATVGLIDEFLSGLPRVVKKYIKGNPRSYIFQYVFVAKPALGHDPIFYSENIQVMDIQWASIKKPLRAIKGHPILNLLLPVGTRRRSFVRGLIHMVRGEI